MELSRTAEAEWSRFLLTTGGGACEAGGRGPRLHPVKMLRFDCCNTGTDKVKYMVIETNTQISGVLPAFRTRRGRSASKES